MTKEQFGRGLQLINAVTTNQIETNDQIDVYYLLLGDLDGDTYLKAIIRLLKTKENMYSPPSPAEIIKYYEEEKDNELEIDNILDYIKRDILLRGKRKQPKYKKEIRKTIEALGGWNYLCSTEDNIDKKFKKVYKEKIEKSKRKILEENKSSMIEMKD